MKIKLKIKDKKFKRQYQQVNNNFPFGKFCYQNTSKFFPILFHVIYYLYIVDNNKETGPSYQEITFLEEGPSKFCTEGDFKKPDRLCLLPFSFRCLITAT